MITDNEVYEDLVKVSEKIKLLTNPDYSNSEKAVFWSGIYRKLSKDIVWPIRRDKRIFGW